MLHSVVAPTGIEPVPSESESEILSIKLKGLVLRTGQQYYAENFYKNHAGLHLP